MTLRYAFDAVTEPTDVTPTIDTPEQLTPDTLARLPSFISPTVSPDGTELACYHDRTGRMELYTIPTDGGEWTQLSDGNVPRNPSGGIEWDPSGESILFHRDEAGDEQNDIYRIDRDGEVTPVVEPDGQAYVADVASDGTVFYVADSGDQLNLYSHDPATQATTQLTEFDQPVYPAGGLGPDESRLAFVSNESADLANRDVYVTDRDGSKVRRLAIGEDGAEATVADWFPDGDRLLIGDDSTDADRAGIYQLADDEIRWLSDGETVEEPAAVAPDGQRVLTTRTRRAATVPVVTDVATGESRELSLPEGVTTPIGDRESAFLDATTVAVGQTTGDRRRSVIAYQLSSDETRTLLAADYGDVDPSLFVTPEYVRYESEDGLSIGALLYEPPTAEPRPAVVKVHGGPPAQSKRGFDVYTQFLVSQGYTVLEPNYRGSIGRGREFRNAIDGGWGGMEQVDVRCGAEWLADRPSVDADRIAVFGGSYGGYSAYCQLTMHPEPWAAGVAWIGMTDLLSLYEESMPHFKSSLERYLGDPADNEAFYRERSPITHVENLTAPIAILHGVNDPRCPISQARAFRDALEADGRSEPADFEYTELGEEGHGSADQDQKARAFELIADFLDRRL